MSHDPPAADDTLVALGFSDAFASAFAPVAGTGRPARVARVEKKQVLCLGRGEPRWLPLRGLVVFLGPEDLDRIAVGDWVVVGDDEAVELVLPRQSCLVRRRVQKRAEAQPIAANVDVVFVVTAMGRDLNVHRLERYVSAVHEAGAEPVIVVNKMDLASPDDDASPLDWARIEALAPVVRISAHEDEALAPIEAHLAPGRTCAFVGSSGVGKSTLINRLLGADFQRTQVVRASGGKGRHTTTSRQLFPTAEGALLIDNPGVRELGLWDAADGLAATFSDIEALAAACRFSDCSHSHEPGCAVQQAVASGDLDADRLQHFRQLEREVAYEARRVSARATEDTKTRWKSIYKEMRTRRRIQRDNGLKS